MPIMRLVIIAAIVVYLAVSMHWQSLAVIVAPLLLAADGLYTSKLTLGGACTSAVVGWLLLASGLKYFGAVMTFYVIGSVATKFRAVAKMAMVCEGAGDLKRYGQRGAQQVAIKGDLFDFSNLHLLEPLF
jgi:uncharacterized membrane protein